MMGLASRLVVYFVIYGSICEGMNQEYCNKTRGWFSWKVSHSHSEDLEYLCTVFMPIPRPINYQSFDTYAQAGINWMYGSRKITFLAIVCIEMAMKLVPFIIECIDHNKRLVWG